MARKKKIRNEKMLEELTNEQIAVLLRDHMCLVCAHGVRRSCGRPFGLRCVEGYDAWLGMEADPENWQNIRNALGIPPKNDE